MTSGSMRTVLLTSRPGPTTWLSAPAASPAVLKFPTGTLIRVFHECVLSY
jgi:hypothetical protein